MPKASKGSKASKVSEAPKKESTWLSSLGIYGYGEEEVPILASLTNASPLLLIGPHGTAKSLLLTRLAEALGLCFRHYNASLLCFDDLLGFPLPDEKGGLKYAETPATVWPAEAVFFDEISRCRPEVQNKLFPIIHEKKVQGLNLKALQYRWAAMNPPADFEKGEEADSYAGSEPLDVALADRFAFIIETPLWKDFTEEEKRAVLVENAKPIPEKAALRTRTLVQDSRFLLASQREALRGSVSEYILALEPLLCRAGIALSPRRLNILHKNICAALAANTALGSPLSDTECVKRTLFASIPNAAFGRPVSFVKLQGAHKEAFAATKLEKDDPIRAVLLEVDPLKRLSLLSHYEGVKKEEVSQITMDAFTELPLGAREAALAIYVNSGLLNTLTPAIASNLCEQYGRLFVSPTINESISSSSERKKAWQSIVQKISALDPAKETTTLISNLLADLWARKKLMRSEDVEMVYEHFTETAKRLGLV